MSEPQYIRGFCIECGGMCERIVENPPGSGRGTCINCIEFQNVLIDDEEYPDDIPEKRACTRCDGRGWLGTGEEDCPDCDGSGER